MDEPDTAEDANRSRRRMPRWFRFGSRLLFLAITVVAIMLAVTMKRLHDRKAAINTIHDVGGTMGYAVSGPEWLRQIIRDEQCFYDPQRVSLGPIAKDNPNLDDDILASVSQSLKNFDGLTALDVRRSDITDMSASVIGDLRSLTHLRLSSTHIGDETISRIKSLPNLQVLWIRDTNVTNACVDDLCQLRSLTDLDIRGTQLDENGVATLKKQLTTCKISH